MLIEAYSAGIRSSDAMIALRAADLIAQRGHAKLALEDDSGAVCLAGALNLASTGTPRRWRQQTIDLLCKIEDTFGIEDAVGWNNEAKRTAADVINVLRRVAEVDTQALASVVH